MSECQSPHPVVYEDVENPGSAVESLRSLDSNAIISQSENIDPLTIKNLIPEVRPEQIILEVQEEDKHEQESQTCNCSNDKIEEAVNSFSADNIDR